MGENPTSEKQAMKRESILPEKVLTVESVRLLKCTKPKKCIKRSEREREREKSSRIKNGCDAEDSSHNTSGDDPMNSKGNEEETSI